MTSLAPQPHLDFSQFNQIAPGVVSGLRAVTKAIDDSGLEKALTELVKVYVSQINGCAFCLQFHLNLAREQGIHQSKLDLVAVWYEAHVFSLRERSALAWAEALTRMADKPIDGNLYRELQQHFNETEIASLTGTIGSINAWNRIAGALHFTPPVK